MGKQNQVDYNKEVIGQVQRVACITGEIRSCLTAAMEVILNLTPRVVEIAAKRARLGIAKIGLGRKPAVGKEEVDSWELKWDSFPLWQTRPYCTEFKKSGTKTPSTQTKGQRILTRTDPKPKSELKPKYFGEIPGTRKRYGNLRYRQVLEN